MRYLLYSFYLVDVVNIKKTRWEPSVNIEHFTIDYGCNRQVVEEVSELLPNHWTAELALAFNVEAVNLSDLTSLMVASKKSEPFGMPQLQESQVRNGLNAGGSSIDIISEEQVVCIWHLTAYSE